MPDPDLTKNDPMDDDAWQPRRRPFRRLFAWLILIGIGLTLLAMIAIILFD